LRPYGLKRKALILGPSFLNAKLEGAKKVPPLWAVLLSSERKPVSPRPSRRVEKSCGAKLRILSVDGGGMRREERP